MRQLIAGYRLTATSIVIAFAMVCMLGFAANPATIQRELAPPTSAEIAHWEATQPTFVRYEAPPLPEMLVQESQPEPVAEPPPQQTREKGRWVWVRVRAYTPWDAIDSGSRFQDGMTATMKDTRVFPNQWGIAADPRIFPYGTRIYVPGYDPSRHYPEDHAWPVDDTGGVIRRHGWRYRTGRTDYPLIEIRFIHGRSARRWGDRVMQVEVFDP